MNKLEDELKMEELQGLKNLIVSPKEIWKITRQNWHIFVLFALYTFFLINGTKNIVEHNTRITTCLDIGYVPLVDGSCITPTEYDNWLKVENTMNYESRLNPLNKEFNFEISEDIKNG